MFIRAGNHMHCFLAFSYTNLKLDLVMTFEVCLVSKSDRYLPAGI